jgi:very-short-patch-repair endonuclease
VCSSTGKKSSEIINYIVDFFCAKANLVIEIDGGQHYSDEGIHRDAERDRYLQAQGLRVLHFSDRDVFLNTEGVLKQILAQIARKGSEVS